jgi:hypothetical protein
MNRIEKLHLVCNFYRNNYKLLKFKLTTYALVGLANKMPVTRFKFESLANGKVSYPEGIGELRHLNEFKVTGILKVRPVSRPTQRKGNQKERNEYVPGPVGTSLLEQLPPISITKKQLSKRYLDIKTFHERATYSTLAILAAMQLGATTHQEIADALGRSLTSLGASISRGAFAHGYVELSRQEGRTKFWRVSAKGSDLLNVML